MSAGELSSSLPKSGEELGNTPWKEMGETSDDVHGVIFFDDLALFRNRIASADVAGVAL